MKKINSLLNLAAIIFVVMGCNALTGEEVARLSIDELTVDQSDLKTQSTTIDLEAGDRLNLWAHMDLEYEGELALEFQLLVIKEGDTLNMLPLNPFEVDITMNEVKTSFNNKTDWRFAGRMNYLDIEDSGTYEFQTLLLANVGANPTINKADLVFKK